MRLDQDFEQVIAACTETNRTHKTGGWINGEIELTFCELHNLGYAHRIDAYDSKENLVGGLYDLHQGAVFFGESMFSSVSNASKACLVALFTTLIESRFVLIDAQIAKPSSQSIRPTNMA